MEVRVHNYDLHIHFFPADDVPGIWVAHCLDFDVVSQGTSLSDAMGMIREAVELVVMDDLGRGLNPRRRRAPNAEWDRVWSAMVGARAQSIGFVLEHQGEVTHVVMFPALVVRHASMAPADSGLSYDLPPVALAPELRAAG